MKPLSALLFVLAGQIITAEAGLVGLRDAFFGTGPYAIAPLNRRVGGLTNPDRCTGIENAKRFQPHQPHECRMLEVTAAGNVVHGGWAYCPENSNVNCQIPMACVDDALCKDNKCGLFDNKEYTTITCSDNFFCGHTAIVDPLSPELDATRWVCDPTLGLAITIAGTMKINNNIRSFDGRNAKVATATTFVPGQTPSSSSASSTSSDASSTTSLTTITDGPSIIVSTATALVTPTADPAATSKKSNMVPIIGGAVGGAAFLALLGTALFILYRRHQRSKTPAPIVLPSFDDSPTSSNFEKGINNSGYPTPGSGGMTPSNWMPTPASTQGAWTPDAINGNLNVNGAYSGTVSEMPTPDMLGRDWNQETSQTEGPHEMSSTPTAAVAWGNGNTKAQGWVDQKAQQQFMGHGLGVGQTVHPAHVNQGQQSNVVVAPGGFPASLTPGMGGEHRAELA